MLMSAPSQAPSVSLTSLPFAFKTPRWISWSTNAAVGQSIDGSIMRTGDIPAQPI